MLWELLIYLVLPLALLLLIRRRRTKRISKRSCPRDINGRTQAIGFSSDTVLITGGAQGIGRELAYKFGERGAKLVLWDIDEQKLHSTHKELEDTGYETFAYTVDCADKEAVLAAAARVREEVGEVTVLVNNAGRYAGKTILQMDDDDMEKTVKLNLISHFWTIRAFLPSMLERNHGYIVAMASSAAFTNFPCMIDYSASKAALVSFMKTLHFEILLTKKSGVTVTCVCPGRVSTAFGDRFKLPGSMAKLEKDRRKMTVEFAAARIIKAIENREFVTIFPSSSAFVAWLGSILPSFFIKRFARRMADKLPEIDLATGTDKE